jgi:hypothetical protein
MALSEDQKAMLKLVAQPDTSYEDIAALMGLSVEDVRAKVEAALAELDHAAKEEPQAPEPVPPPAPEPPPEPVPPKAEEKIPEPPAPAGRQAKAEPAPRSARKRPAAGRPKVGLPQDRGARYGILAGAAVLILLVVLLVTGVLGGDGDSGETATTAASEAGKGQPTPTQAILEEVGGSGASGRALFARSGSQVVLALRVKNVDPAPKGNFYAVSLANSKGEQIPLVATASNEKDEIVNAFKIKPQYLGFLASGYDQMQVALVPTREFEAALVAAKKGNSSLKYGGTVIAGGAVTGPAIEKAEQAAEEAEAEG